MPRRQGDEIKRRKIRDVEQNKTSTTTKPGNWRQPDNILNDEGFFYDVDYRTGVNLLNRMLKCIYTFAKRKQQTNKTK